MADKYLKQSSGVLTEVAATVTSAGAGDAGKIPGLDSSGRLDNSMMPVGATTETDLITATEALSAGDFVNIYDATGAKCRKADATIAGKEANGFVLAAVILNGVATVFRISQTNTQLTGMTPGKKQYLATTAGGRTETAPAGAGNVVQQLGIAKSATELIFAPNDPIVLA